MSFWANKLNGTPAAMTTAAPVRDLYGMYRPLDTPETAPAQDYAPSVPMTAGSHCPECGTDNYMSNGSYAITCPACGYHPRFKQSGSGIRVPTDPSNKATPARQLDAAGTNLKAQIAQMNANQHSNISNIQGI